MEEVPANGESDIDQINASEHDGAAFDRDNNSKNNNLSPNMNRAKIDKNNNICENEDVSANKQTPGYVEHDEDSSVTGLTPPNKSHESHLPKIVMENSKNKRQEQNSTPPDSSDNQTDEEAEIKTDSAPDFEKSANLNVIRTVPTGDSPAENVVKETTCNNMSYGSSQSGSKPKLNENADLKSKIKDICKLVTSNIKSKPKKSDKELDTGSLDDTNNKSTGLVDENATLETPNDPLNIFQDSIKFLSTSG